MNEIATYPASRGDLAYLEIEVDGKPLAHHFTGRQGTHASPVSPLGWSCSGSEEQAVKAVIAATVEAFNQHDAKACSPRALGMK